MMHYRVSWEALKEFLGHSFENCAQGGLEFQHSTNIAMLLLILVLYENGLYIIVEATYVEKKTHLQNPGSTTCNKGLNIATGKPLS